VSAARFRVTGKVQGVWFRAATRERAQALAGRDAQVNPEGT